uniref:CX9C domain-containing protein n=1 Tax=Steinernema glaseri TaxID=37863 RepID=A0A1I8ABI8_9BILA
MNFREEAIFASKKECMMLAYNLTQVIYQTVTTASGIECWLTRKFIGFLPPRNKEGNTDAYLLDLSDQNDDQCKDPSQLDVRKFLKAEKECDLEPEMCAEVEKALAFCTTKANNAMCIDEKLNGKQAKPGGV